MSRPATAARNSTADWQALDRRHHLHPFTDHEALAKAAPASSSTAEGAYVWDSDGQRILDAMAGLWCVNIGYGRQELADAAYRQMLELPYYNTFFKTTTPPAARAGASFSDLPPRASSTCSMVCRARTPTTPSSAWCGITGTCRARRPEDHHQPATTAITAPPWSRPASAA